MIWKNFIHAEKYVLLAKVPLMTEKGTFIISGNTRIIVETRINY
jgi:DNA-directed RNA polymerase beta subunit